MANRQKPIKRGTTPEPEPENPVAPPGTGFIMVGKAMYNEEGIMLLDEDGETTEEYEDMIEEDGLDPDGNPLKD
jgi:hypothetical protein